MKHFLAAALLLAAAASAARADEWAAGRSSEISRLAKKVRDLQARQAILPEPYIAGAVGEDPEKTQRELESSCAKDGVRYRSALAGQRMEIRDSSGNMNALAMCAPEGQSVLNGFMYVLLAAVGENSPASVANLRASCQNQDPRGAITGQILAYNVGSRKDPEMAAVGVCRYHPPR